MRLPSSRAMIATAALAAALAAFGGLALRPTGARAQVVPAPGARYQLVVSGEPFGWLVLDTQTGEIERWYRAGGEYVVHTLRVRSAEASARRVRDPRLGL